MFKFHQERLDEDTRLGGGRFGEVFPYQKQPQDLKWVVKRIHAKNIDELLACLPEVVLGFACDHCCIVPVKGYFVEKIPNSKYFHIYMKMPRMKETLLTNFKDRKRKKDPYSEQEIVRHFYSLVHGISYLHSKKIYHGDIKPDNLLFDNNGALKIADVGIAKHVEDEDSYQTFTGLPGTYQYSAPEIVGKDIQNTKKNMLAKADIWSLGVVMLELCVFDFRLLNAGLPQELQNKVDKFLADLEGKYSKALLSLIQKLLSSDPNERPDIIKIKDELEKDFLQFLDKDLVSLSKANLTQPNQISEEEIRFLNKKILDISENFQTERKQFEEKISQLELNLSEQKQQHEERVKALIGQANSKAREEFSEQETVHRLSQKKFVALEGDLRRQQEELQKQFDIISSKNQELSNLEQQIRSFQQEETSLKQHCSSLQGELQKCLDTICSKDEKLNSLEQQIQKLQQEKVRSEEKNKELKKDLDASFKNLNDLQSKTQELENFKVEKIPEGFSQEEYKINLQNVVSKLSLKWEDLFTVESDEMRLKITQKKLNILLLSQFSSPVGIKDKELSSLSKDIIATLQESKLLHLKGLNINCIGCYQLTDKSFEHLATAISTQSLTLQSLHLDFRWCDQLTDKSFEQLATAISTQSLTLQSLYLNFDCCYQLTDKSFEHLANAMSIQAPYLQSLNLDFNHCNQLTDKSFEHLATAISTQSPTLQSLHLDFLGTKISRNEAIKFEKAVKSLCSKIKNLELKFNKPLWEEW